MKSLSIVSLALVVLLGSAVGLCAAESETFTGTAAASGTYKRPQLLVDGKRYELKASDKADASVAEVLDRFSKGDTGTYVVKGRRGTVNGVDGILIDSITPARADPGTGAPAAAKRPGYKVHDHVVKATPPATGEHKFRLVVPEGLAVVRGILVVGPYSGGDSRDYHEQVWYREFLNLHGFAFLGAKDFYLHDYQVMQAALKQLAIDTKHPELVNAPYAATGFSAGGGYTRLLMKADPDKVIAGDVVGSTTWSTSRARAAAWQRPWSRCWPSSARRGRSGGGWPSRASATSSPDRKCWPCRSSTPRSDSVTPPTATGGRGR